MKMSVDRKPTIYIAGPMRGYEDGNFPAFDRQARVLEEQGWIVINPAEMDRQEGEPQKDIWSLTLQQIMKTVNLCGMH